MAAALVFERASLAGFAAARNWNGALSNVAQLAVLVVLGGAVYFSAMFFLHSRRR